MGMVVSVTEFKARCLEFFERLSKGEIDEIDVTKRGRKVAVVRPPKFTREDVERWHGFMRGRVHIPDDLDIVAPIAADQEFEPDLPEP